MTRPIVILLFATSIFVTAGCGGDAPRGMVADPQTQGWVEAPVIDAALRQADGLRISGKAPPNSRIVIRGDAGTAFAVATGSDGRFGLRIPTPASDTLYVIELQVGEDTLPAATRLLVARDAAGPIALISPGSPTLRLDPGAGLDVVDSDGRTRIASGRAGAGDEVTVSVNGGEPTTIATDPSGRWTLDLGASGSSATSITVEGSGYVYPGDDVAQAPIGQLTPLGDGVGLRWTLSDTAEQSSWFPGQGPTATARQPD